MRYKVKQYLDSMKREARLHKEKIPTMRELRAMVSTIEINRDRLGIIYYAKPNLRNLYTLISYEKVLVG